MHTIYRDAKGKRAFIAEIAREGRYCQDYTLIGHCTFRYRDAAGNRFVRYHETDIVTVRPNGQLEIDAGGYGHSPNCRRKIGEALTLLTGVEYTVWGNPGRGLDLLRRNPACKAPDYVGPYWIPVAIFVDKLTIGPRGGIKSDYSEDKSKKLNRAVDRYIREWSKRGIPPYSSPENAGDPWIWSPDQCDRAMVADWVRTRYVCRKILEIAILDAGRNPMGWMPSNANRADGRIQPSKDHLRWVRRYVKRKLGMP